MGRREDSFLPFFFVASGVLGVLVRWSAFEGIREDLHERWCMDIVWSSDGGAGDNMVERW